MIEMKQTTFTLGVMGALSRKNGCLELEDKLQHYFKWNLIGVSDEENQIRIKMFHTRKYTLDGSNACIDFEACQALLKLVLNSKFGSMDLRRHIKEISWDICSKKSDKMMEVVYSKDRLSEGG